MDLAGARRWLAIVDLFGYSADDASEMADFGLVTGIGLGMFRELLLIERDVAVLRWAHPNVGIKLPPKEKVSYRYDRRIMDKSAMVPWWRHRRLDPGPGRFAPPRLSDVLGKLV